MANIETPTYYISDTQRTTNDIRKAIAESDMNNANFLTSSMDKIDQTKLSNITNSFETALNTEIGAYLTNTESMAFQNELYNTNMYINHVMTMQEEQINELSETARNRIMKYRQKYQLKLYDIHYYKFVRTVLLFAIFIISVFGILLVFTYKYDPPLLSPTITWIIIGIVITIYILLLFLYVRNNSSRRKTDWNKFYFGDNGIPKKGDCS